MREKKPPGDVEASIARLREIRYMTKGPGAARARKPAITVATVEKLRAVVAKVSKKSAKKKSKKRRGK